MLQDGLKLLNDEMKVSPFLIISGIFPLLYIYLMKCYIRYVMCTSLPLIIFVYVQI